jgi:hypothetical protein
MRQSRSCRAAVAALAALAIVSAAACRETAQGVEHGDVEYFCAEWAPVWCLAFAECDPANFLGSFQTLDECFEASERSCLDPAGGGATCADATRDETDGCVDYIEVNTPDGCHLLFGPSADWSPCEEICAP